MKKYIQTTLYKIAFSICLSAFAFNTYSQVDRTKAPAPGPAPEIKIGTYEKFSLDNGLKVFVVENHRIPRVSFSFLMDFTPVLEKENAGYTELAGQMLGTATKTRNKAQIDEAIDFIGGTLNTSANSMYASSLTKHTEKLLEIAADVLLNPVFKEDELEKLRKQTISGLAAAKEDPSSVSEILTSILVYGKNHPYGESPTEKTVENVTVEMAQNFIKTYFKPNVSYLVIVGDITPANAKKLAKKYFGAWKRGDVPSHTYDAPQAPEKRMVALVDRPASVQSVVKVSYPMQLNPGTQDYLSAQVMNTTLGGGTNRLFNNLREKHGYTYGAYSSLTINKLSSRFTAAADVRNEVTDSALYQILYEMNRLKTEVVPDDELSRIKNSMSGTFALSLERPQTVASFALNTERYNLPDDYYRTYLQRLSAITSNDVQKAANNYLKPNQSYVVVVGKASEVAEQLTSVSADNQVRYFDMYGNEYDPTEKAAIPQGITANTIVENYIKAIGGKEKLEKVKSLSMEMKMTMQGMQINMNLYKIQPAKYAMKLMMNGNVIQQVTYNNGEAMMKGMQGEQKIEGKELTGLKYETYPFSELVYSTDSFLVKFNGTEEVNGKDAYIVDVTVPSGSSVTEYFDKETGLKVKSAAIQESPMGEMLQVTEYLNYKETDGILFPSSFKQSVAGQIIDVEVVQVTLNPAIPEEIFN